jgi:glycosyltransferase involved in cell wall biosynthesis
LLTARLIWDKGIKEYVEAARILKDKYGAAIECQLLGFLNANNPHAIPEMIVNQWHTDGHINYIGATDDVRPYLEQANCFVLPSFYCEGTPRSLLEAASMELPIITTDNQGCRNVVEDGFNGFLVSTKNSIELATKMEQMFLLPTEEQTKMGKNGRYKIITTLEESLVIPYYLNALKNI